MKKLFCTVFVLTAWYTWAGASGERSPAVQADSPYSRPGAGGEYFQTAEPDSPYSRPDAAGESIQPAAHPKEIGEAKTARPGSGIGVDTRDEIAWRKAWVDRLGECDRYVADYIRNTPLPALLVYSATAERGAIDWERETTAISFRIALYPDKAWPIPLKNMMNETYSAFAATGKAEAWGIKWPTRAVSGEPSPIRAETTREYLAAVELVNGQGQVIGTQSVSLSAGWKTGFT
ncbi:MAG: hypothetical protein LBG26_01005, partial [Treponema sp.]|nr:hypothetical protein [Treponema sp.]